MAASTKKARLGDIVEVQTSKGLAYLQYTHEESGGMGSLVRILPGLYETRPTDFTKLANQKELYSTFCTLRLALRKGDARIVSHEPIPEWAKPWPMMRSSNGMDRTGKTASWKILRADTPFTLEELRKVQHYRELTPEQERLSIHSLWNHQYLVKRLAEGWTPERAEEFRLREITDRKASIAQTPQAESSENQTMQHYLYFPRKQDAERAAQILREKDFKANLRLGADGKNWLVLVTSSRPGNEQEIDSLREELEGVADDLGGEYDGWEISVHDQPIAKPN